MIFVQIRGEQNVQLAGRSLVAEELGLQNCFQDLICLSCYIHWYANP